MGLGTREGISGKVKPPVVGDESLSLQFGSQSVHWSRKQDQPEREIVGDSSEPSGVRSVIVTSKYCNRGLNLLFLCFLKASKSSAGSPFLRPRYHSRRSYTLARRNCFSAHRRPSIDQHCFGPADAGAGKTLFLQVLAGRVKGHKGQITYNGERLTYSSLEGAPRA